MQKLPTDLNVILSNMYFRIGLNFYANELQKLFDNGKKLLYLWEERHCYTEGNYYKFSDKYTCGSNMPMLPNVSVSISRQGENLYIVQHQSDVGNILLLPCGSGLKITKVPCVFAQPTCRLKIPLCLFAKRSRFRRAWVKGHHPTQAG